MQIINFIQKIMIYSLAPKYNNKKYYKNYSIKIGKFRGEYIK